MASSADIAAELERRKQAAPTVANGANVAALQAEIDRRRGKQVVKEHWEQPWYWRLANTVGDLGKVGAQGVTLGFSDEIAAGAQSLAGYDYDEAVKARRQGIADSKARMNDITPYSAEVFEGATSMINPLSRAGILGLGTAGGLSTYGHSEEFKPNLPEIAAGTGVGMGLGVIGKGISNIPMAANPLASAAQVYSRQEWLPWAVGTTFGLGPAAVVKGSQAAAKYTAPALQSLGRSPSAQLNLFTPPPAPVVPWRWPQGAAQVTAAGGR